MTPKIISSASLSSDDPYDDIDALFWSMYTMPISVGNPPLNLTAIVDTSWSPMFIPSANCTLDPSERPYCRVHHLYNSTLSSTYRANLTSARVYYTGPAGFYTYGKVSQDSIHVAGVEIKSQTFEEAIQLRPDAGTNDELFDTVFGLALFQTVDGGNWSDFTAPSPFQNMIEQGLLDENVFTLKFPRTREEKGEITLGGLPSNLRQEDLIEMPLNHKIDDSEEVWKFYAMNGWQVSLSRMTMAFNSSNASIPVLDKPQVAVISSSFPWIGLPTDVAARANKAIGLDYAFHWVNCTTRPQLPNWTINFEPGNQSITLTPWDYLIQAYDYRIKEDICVSAFYDLGKYGDKGFVLLGAPFLDGLYSVFNADRKSISFGNRPL
ncbi:aspartic peptidase domain-containing protein [Massariosphaeria phaeospora]|uniref:Aspartic peptidase domain-containing protein n=1 Tax=Massariosphaeria phaeospora TaxID=100035 RepID=A0A7C8I6A3_9PLEO|nr:aspartic peptidase domain-containing protein [Massariosphaeria phaeospora]